MSELMVRGRRDGLEWTGLHPLHAQPPGVMAFFIQILLYIPP